MITNNLRLTEMTKGSGCGCKVAPALLESILSQVDHSNKYKDLIGGYEKMDDAAIYQLNENQYILSTVDFFTPVVDHPFDFGRIAAANSISDIYAMGGKPMMATSILGFPTEKLPPEIVREIMNGAIAICKEAGIPIAGGHSIDNPEPFFGLSVMGTVAPINLRRNTGAHVGDFIYITKPLGAGILNTAIKRGIASEEHIASHVQNISRLNKEGELMGTLSYIHAMTDITGFALLGHLVEMAEGSGVSAKIYMRDIPVYPFLDAYLMQNCLPDNTYRNWNAYEKKIGGLNDMRAFQILNDPQTNGGIMVSVDRNHVTEFEALMSVEQIAFYQVGEMKEKGERVVDIVL